jgi:transposase
MGPRYLGADAAKYRDTVNVEPCWSIKVVPRSLKTWQGLGWAPRYKNPDLHATAGDQQVKPTYYG